MTNLWCLLLAVSSLQAVDRATVEAAAAQAVDYATQHLADYGGYLWWYRTDLQEQAGEGSPVPRGTIWVQPPGTPTVGEALLRLAQVTGDQRYLDAAVKAGEALAWGQLASGGWFAYVQFDQPTLDALHYRHDWERDGKPSGKRRNTSTYDDDITQSALRFLLKLDRQLHASNAAIHHAVGVGLAALVETQHPNGGWTQVFTEAPDPSEPVLQASFPETWRERPSGASYWFHFTLNDGVLQQNVTTLYLAADLLDSQRCRAAATKAGDFLLRAQLPAPQPVWAQQYDQQMHPAWARKFEPPAASSWETMMSLETLLEIWLRTGDAKYRQAMDPALAWLDQVRLKDGPWARFYELQTNRPLYLTSDYKLTYDDSDTPAHYGFKQDLAARLEQVRNQLKLGRDKLVAQRAHTPTAPERQARLAELEPRVAEALASLDAQGRWVTVQTSLKGKALPQPREILDMQVLVDHLNLLAEYLELTRP